MKDDIAEKRFLYGNFNMHLQYAAAEKIKLGDALAASSCFPAGFEPIIFPVDFANQTLTIKDILKETCVEPQELKLQELEMLYTNRDIETVIAEQAKPVNIEVLRDDVKALPLKNDFEVGFMDGGVDDNQGLESIMRANDRRIKHTTNFKPFDLMFINDVGSHYMDPLKPEKKKPGIVLVC